MDSQRPPVKPEAWRWEPLKAAEAVMCLPIACRGTATRPPTGHPIRLQDGSFIIHGITANQDCRISQTLRASPALPLRDERERGLDEDEDTNGTAGTYMDVHPADS